MGRFLGGLLGGGKGGSSGGASGGKGSSASGSSLERAMAAKNASQSNNGKKLSADERYEQLIQQKFEDNKKALMSGAKRTNNMLTGKKTEAPEQSKSAQVTMEMLAMKMAKKQAKRAKKGDPVEVKYTPFGGSAGGHIDKKGRVMNAYGQQVLQIDLKSGKIKTVGFFGGSSIGKYDPKSSYCLYKIQKKVEEYNVKKGLGGGSIWGTSSSTTSSSSGSPWSIYGTTSDD